LFSGPIAAVDRMIEACREGPAAARVTDIEIAVVEGRAEPGFRQLPTL
jgi:acylphosphatase